MLLHVNMRMDILKMSDWWVVTFPLVSAVRCGASLFQFLIFSLFFNFDAKANYPVIAQLVASFAAYSIPVSRLSRMRVMAKTYNFLILAKIINLTFLTKKKTN